MNSEPEIWKQSPIYPRYEANNMGMIRNKRTGNICKYFKNVNGHLSLSIGIDRSWKTCLAAPIIYRCFNPFFDIFKRISYLDGNKENLKIENLYEIDMFEQNKKRWEKLSPTNRKKWIMSGVKAQKKKRLALLKTSPYTEIKANLSCI